MWLKLIKSRIHKLNVRIPKQFQLGVQRLEINVAIMDVNEKIDQ